MEKSTLQVKEAAALLGVSLPTMYDITERADFFPLIRVGRRKLIVTDRFKQWIDIQTEPKANNS